MISLSRVDTPVTALQFGSADDMPNRDPYSITVEGSDSPDTGKDFVLLYEGDSGLEIDPGRKSWGRVMEFSNTRAYKSYRVLIMDTRANADAAQYGEVRLGTKSRP